MKKEKLDLFSRHEKEKIERFKASYFENTMEDVEVQNSMLIIMEQLLDWERKSKTKKQTDHIDRLKSAILKIFSFNVTNKSKLSRAIVELLEEREINRRVSLEIQELRKENTTLKKENKYLSDSEKQLNEKIHELTKFDPK